MTSVAPRERPQHSPPSGLLSSSIQSDSLARHLTPVSLGQVCRYSERQLTMLVGAVTSYDACTGSRRWLTHLHPTQESEPWPGFQGAAFSWCRPQEAADADDSSTRVPSSPVGDQMEFPAPGLCLSQAWLTQHLETELSDGRSPCLSLCVALPFKENNSKTNKC